MENETGERRQTVLIVDGNADNIVLISLLLTDRYRIRIAMSGERGLALAATEPRPDLILLDAMMDGYEVCRRLKADPDLSDIPVIFLTGVRDDDDEARGLATGAVDYVGKPVNAIILRARISTHLSLRGAQLRLRQHNRMLEAEVTRRTEEVHRSQQVTILALASLAETRDNETGYHIQRVQHYVELLAQRLKDSPRFAQLESDEYVDLLVRSVPLHDIGKVGIPDHILLKPGRLTTDEFEVMKQHTRIGHDALLEAERRLGVTDSNLYLAREVAIAHHERWDGEGYPNGLSGDDIPLSARLMTVADVYDACVSRRIYKAPMPHRQVVGLILQGSGTQFDPEVADAFSDLEEEFSDIAERLADPQEESA